MGNENSKKGSGKRGRDAGGSVSSNNNPTLVRLPLGGLGMKEEPAVLLRGSTVSTLNASRTDGHLVIATVEGEAMVCGNGDRGQLGLPLDDAKKNPVLPTPLTIGISGPVKIISVVVSPSTSHFLTDTGKVFGCGSSGDGLLGLGFSVSARQPRLLSSLNDIVHITGGYDHILCLDRRGVPYSWGVMSQGRLGLGEPGSRSTSRAGAANEPSPQPISGVYSKSKRMMHAAAGGAHTVLLSETGEVLTCGRGAEGQLGYGGRQEHWFPRVMSASSFLEGEETEDVIGDRILRVFAGADTSFAVTRNGNVWVWGGSATKPVRLFVDGHALSVVCNDSGRNLIHTVDGKLWQMDNSQISMDQLHATPFQSSELIPGSMSVNAITISSNSAYIALGGAVARHVEPIVQSPTKDVNTTLREQLMDGKDNTDVSQRAVQRARKEAERAKNTAPCGGKVGNDAESMRAALFARKDITSRVSSPGPSTVKSASGDMKCDERNRAEAKRVWGGGPMQKEEKAKSGDSDAVDDVAMEIFGDRVPETLLVKGNGDAQKSIETTQNPPGSGNIGKRRQKINASWGEEEVSPNRGQVRNKPAEDEDEVRNALFAPSKRKKKRTKATGGERSRRAEEIAQHDATEEGEVDSEHQQRTGGQDTTSPLAAVTRAVIKPTPRIQDNKDYDGDGDALDELLARMDDTFMAAFGESTPSHPTSSRREQRKREREEQEMSRAIEQEQEREEAERRATIEREKARREQERLAREEEERIFREKQEEERVQREAQDKEREREQRLAAADANIEVLIQSDEETDEEEGGSAAPSAGSSASIAKPQNQSENSCRYDEDEDDTFSDEDDDEDNILFVNSQSASTSGPVAKDEQSDEEDLC